MVVHVVIYGLYDPTDPLQLTRYVGKEKKQGDRLGAHIKESARYCTSSKHVWIGALLARGVKPCRRTLDVVPASVWAKSERRWIASFPPGQLVNSTIGGEGVGGLPEEARLRRNAAIGRALKGNNNHPKGTPGTTISEEGKRSISVANTNRPRPDARSRQLAFYAKYKGRVRWITNGEYNQRFVVGLQTMPKGFWFGRVCPNRKPSGRNAKGQFEHLL